jgi:hypothetical protein
MSDQAKPQAGLFAPSNFRLNLEQQRKRARDLQHGLRAGDPAALARFRRHHPRADTGPMAELHGLSEAQLVIAREVGLPSWPRLKAHILAMDAARATIARETIARAAPAPDGELSTLHIRCGSDIRAPLAAAGFCGEFLEYGDPLCQGPVTDRPDWTEQRAVFLSGAYGGRTLAETRAWLAVAEDGLRAAASRYERVVLWFEHDSYDQLNLVRSLALFAETTPARLELITIDRYPGSARFIGLGQLPPEALRLLWGERRPVCPAQLALGRAIWQRLRAADPSPLAQAARAGTPALPSLAPALRRHCQELPGLADGLSLTQRLVLELLSEGARTANDLFSALMLGREPLPWLGDLMFASILRDMKRVREKVFTASFAGEERSWPREHFAITDLGRAVLAGETDFLSLAPRERWVGGVRIRPTDAVWRWDEAAGGTVKTVV